MSWEDPTTVEGARVTARPMRRGIAIRLEHEEYHLSVDDARGFIQRVAFAIELCERDSLDRRLAQLARYR